jgi:hypothetical protein
MSLSASNRNARASLAGGGSRAAEPPSATAWHRCVHGALRVRITNTVPSGPAPAAAPEERA